MTERRQQLRMVWPIDQRRVLPLMPIPEGYVLRPYRSGDDQACIDLMTSSGSTTYGAERLAEILSLCLPDGWFFAIHKPSGEFGAAAAALHRPLELHPFGGELGDVAAAPNHRGKGLGLIVSAAATQRMVDAGYSNIYLKTDDHRLPAIKTYLRLGYVPFLYAPDMQERWVTVLGELGIDETGVGWRFAEPLGRWVWK